MLATGLLSWLLVLPAQAAVLEQIAEFAVPDANQGVGVDRDHFYAVTNRVIGKYDKRTGALIKKWQGDKEAPSNTSTA